LIDFSGGFGYNNACNMGFTNVPIKIKNPMNPKKEKLNKFLVDSGALYSVVPSKQLSDMGVRSVFKQSFTLANGEVVTYDVGNVLFEYKGKEIGSPVIFGQKDDIYLLGVTTLESFGYVLDPVTRELRKMPMLLM
jgi:predicted aspartyl protease